MTQQPNREVAVLNAALELRPAERADYLSQACAGDAALRQQVEALLQAHEQAESFLEAPPAGLDYKRTVRVEIPLTEKAGDKIGRYKLLQQIGEGGCGVVYMADQEEPVHRRVALKVIKLGMDTKQVIARFEAERQALALMDHPNIAKVLDAGATGAGRPYFVMELVRGIKITDFCDENKLSTADRLKLFIQVCQAIQHAHQKGVIHRDIKPSNILVTINDGVPVPKVIDFGIAKATQGRLTDQTLFTAFEQFIGTPAYMSPEQAVMTSLDIDTRSDIYSLGVLLYELLTGRTPFDQKELLAAGLDEMRRTIREEEPPRPSMRLSTLAADALTTTANHRHTDAPKLVHVVRGDLDWIAMKCLEKDRARRYETANGLAMDLQLHLNNEPVVACPPSNFYRFQKLVRRNKLAFAAGAAVLVALVAGLVVSSLFFVKEKAARRNAMAAEKQAWAINRFLTQDVLGQVTPEKNPRAKNVTLIEALDAATARLSQSAEIRQQPKLEASLRLAVGSTYSKLGLLNEAERNLRRAFILRRSSLGPQDLDTLAAQHALANLLFGGRKNWEESGTLAREAWQGRLRLLGPEDSDTLKSQELYEETLREGGRLQEAEAIARQILPIRERVFGPDNPDTIAALGNLGIVLGVRGDYAESEHYIREALTRFQRIGSEESEDGFFCVKEIAMSRLLQGDPVEAGKRLAEGLPRAVKQLGPDHYLTLHIQRALVRALAEQGKLDEAAALGEETLNALRRTRADQEDIGLGRTLLYLGRVLVEQGKLDVAEPLLQQALTLLRKDAASKLRPELPAQAANWLGAIQLARKAYPEAEALLQPGAERFFAPAAEMSPNERRLAVGHIVKLYEASDRPKEAAVLQKKLDDYFAKSQTAVKAQ